MNRHLKKRLEIVWRNELPARYIPRSLDGGTGWGTFDRKLKRFLTDAEVIKLDPDKVKTENFHNA